MNDKELIPFATMSKNDEDIAMVHKWVNGIRKHHFNNYKDIKKHLWEYTHMYYVGDISPLSYYRELLFYMTKYQERCAFVTDMFNEMYDYFSKLYNAELKIFR